MLFFSAKPVNLVAIMRLSWSLLVSKITLDQANFFNKPSHTIKLDLNRAEQSSEKTRE